MRFSGSIIYVHLETFLSDFVVSFFLQTLVATGCGVAIPRVYIIMLGLDGGGMIMSAYTVLL